MYLESGNTIYLRRANGIEQQYRLLCPGCKLFCAYRPIGMKMEMSKLLVNL